MSMGHLKKGCLTMTPNLLSQKMDIWAAVESLEAYVQQNPLKEDIKQQAEQGIHVWKYPPIC